MKDLDGVFRLQADPSATLSWKVIPDRNLLELWRHPAANERGSVCLTRQLEPRLMKLLCLLADAQGQVITRDDLMTALWPRVVVNENSLTRAVSDLRKALNPAPLAAATNSIETVPKRGYRLQAPLWLADAETVEPATAPAVALAVTTRSPIQRLSSYGILALAIAVSAVVSSVWTQKTAGTLEPAMLVAETRSAEPAPVLEDRVLANPLALPPGLQWRESMHVDQDDASTAVMAPDGRFMAFVETFSGQSQLRLRSLDKSGEVWTVFSSQGAITHLQWSPLDAGLLFTVQDPALTPAAVINNAPDAQQPSRLARLMLLDLESMKIRELYRRAIDSAPDSDVYINASGNLT